ncbi:uncharacterized protein LOC111629617 [Centruroides sculpturatus]|uniref:uncharacterized protein LOC111629617 n=1 Tax=Centruroides sculpturatus TaxID=218467 RepID=UPI000C6D5110|nr:uncharacterized protein LOC111629617 [Centruroides sculpturatus]
MVPDADLLDPYPFLHFSSPTHLLHLYLLSSYRLCLYWFGLAFPLHVYSRAHLDFSTGGAFIVKDHKGNTIHQHYFKMEGHCTNNQAESRAILKAIQYIQKSPSIFHNTQANIYTDSKVALHQIQNSNMNLPMIKETIQTLKRINSTNITLAWIKGHSGLASNEMADFLAKKAITNLKNFDYEKIPFKWIINQVYSYICKCWRIRWDNSNTARLMHRFFPFVNERKVLSHLSPDYESTQIITGHGNFKGYLARFLKKGKGYFNTCADKWEDSEHVLLHCPQYNKERTNLIATVISENIAWPCPLDILIKNRNICKAFKDFNCKIRVLS